MALLIINKKWMPKFLKKETKAHEWLERTSFFNRQWKTTCFLSVIFLLSVCRFIVCDEKWTLFNLKLNPKKRGFVRYSVLTDLKNTFLHLMCVLIMSILIITLIVLLVIIVVGFVIKLIIISTIATVIVKLRTAWCWCMPQRPHVWTADISLNHVYLLFTV